MTLREHFHQTWKELFQPGHVAVADFCGPILLLVPKRRRMELAQTRGLHIAVTTEAVESLPVLPTSFANEMVWIHASIPVTKMWNFLSQRPAIFILFSLDWRRSLVERLDRDLMSSKTSRTVFSFFTVIRMGQNAATFENEKTFFTYRVEGVSVFGVVRNAFGFDLERPVQKHSSILHHLAAHFLHSSSRWSFDGSHCFFFVAFCHNKPYRGHTSFIKRRLSIKVDLKKACPCSL